MEEYGMLFQEPPVILFGSPDLTPTRLLRTELRRRGATVVMASSLGETISLAGRLRAALLVLDEELGGRQAPDVASCLREAFPSAEIVLLRKSGSALPGGVGLGLLYSGPADIALDSLLEIIQAAFPNRLRRPLSQPPHAGPVLCVDDDGPYLSSLARLLTRHGYRVSAFGEGAPALRAIPDLAPALAILDVAMPGMDGLELARTIRTTYGGRIPVILLSGKSSGADAAAGFRHGASRFIAKADGPRRLLDAVDYYAGDLDSQERELLEVQE